VFLRRSDTYLLYCNNPQDHNMNLRYSENLKRLYLRVFLIMKFLVLLNANVIM
jgi:hypothetical protein